MIFKQEEYDKITTIILFPEYQIWKDVLYPFIESHERLEEKLALNLGCSVKSIDQLEDVVFSKVEENENNTKVLFGIAKSVIKFVVELEEFFNTDLEMSCPEVRIIYNMINKVGADITKQKSFKKLRAVVEKQVELEISGNHNPSTITALNSIINATDENYKSAAFHSTKEVVNTWIPYFTQEYSSFRNEEQEVVIKALRFTFLKTLVELN